MTRSSSDLPPENGQQPDDLGPLRSLLVGPEEAEIRSLKERLDDPAKFAQAVGDVLIPALRHSAEQEQELDLELGPPVEKAVRSFIRDDPDTVADAIFPAIGPAIRKSIAASLHGLVQSINRSLEHSFTAKGLKWRLEARRSGRPFAEVVLKHSLIYRVEQVFLIHRETGLLLEHVVAESVESPDADVISAMLTAIQDFVHDSFEGPRGQGLDSLRLGDLTVVLEHGPGAVLAAVVRGQPPVELREALVSTVESLHREYGYAFEKFSGDTAPFEPTRDQLERCLAAQYAEDDATMALPKWFWVVLVASIIGIALWSWLSLQSRWRWQDYLDTLQMQPGVVVTDARRTSLSGGMVRGLRDPLAASPGDSAEAAGIDPARIDARWQPYQSLEPELVLARARQILSPPTGVDVDLDGDRLLLRGEAPHSWMTQALTLARAVPGVREIDASGVVDVTASQYAAAVSRVDGRRLHFGAKSFEPVEDLATVVSDVAELQRLAGELGVSIELGLIGRSDGSGSSVPNLELSLQRARHVQDALMAGGVTMALDVEGRGDLDRIAAPEDRADAENRSVTLRVQPKG